MSVDEEQTDVFVCGAGPVGLLIAYSLARMGVKTYIIERYDKEQQPMYGRASTLYPRTIELLDQLDLLEKLTQIGFIGRSSVTFKDGKRVTTRGWHPMFSMMHGTYFDYLLNIRLKYSEAIMKQAYEDLGGLVHVGWVLEDIAIEQGAVDGRRVSATIRETSSKKVRRVKSKYIVGADGGNSTVRKLAAIPFRGDSTKHRLVRIDGVVKSNMADQDLGFASIESATHGNVLWVRLDHGRTRVGFALTPELYAKYGEHMTEDQVKNEAKKAMSPFTLEFVKVDWWTIYTVNQKIADNYFSHNSVLLAGDACHTHSSGAAQGMNVGTHDAVNLAWKLGGVIRGWYSGDLLRTYEEERRPVAEELLRIDKTLSAVVSGELPEEEWMKNPSSNPNELLTATFNASVQFNIGLGIHYDCNLLNWTPNTGTVSPGRRGPDALLRAPGFPLGIRLFELTKNIGAFWILVFAGHPQETYVGLEALRTYVDSSTSVTKSIHPDAVRFLTIVAGSPGQGDTMLGANRFGKAYYDVDISAHTKYGISTQAGAVVILRPDGMLAFASSLDKMQEVGSYFLKLSGRPTHQNT